MIPTQKTRKPRTVRQAKGNGTEDWHGTPYGYVQYKCGCDRCREWNRVRMQAHRAARRTL